VRPSLSLSKHGLDRRNYRAIWRPIIQRSAFIAISFDKKSSLKFHNLAHAAHSDPRRFPPPRSIDEGKQRCFIVRDANGQALGYFYFEDEPGRRSAAKLLTRDEARRIAANIATLPDSLR